MAADGSLQALLARWREQGADRVDPVGFHRLQALLRRCEAADAPVRAALQPRIAALADAHATMLDRASPPANVVVDAASPLAVLVADCAARRTGNDTAAAAGGDMAPAGAVAPSPPPTLRQARHLWGALRTERQLKQSLATTGEDAGPLNSARLVNRMLQRMGEASPGYLQHCIAYLDVLSELEHWLGPMQAVDAPSPAPGRKLATKRPARKRMR